MSVQFCRLALALYVAGLLWPLWNSRHSAAVSGVMMLGLPAAVVLVALGSSFIRARFSRWLMATSIILVPLAFWWSSLVIGVFSWPAWWEWPLVLPLELGLPVALAVALFRDPGAAAYFNGHKA